MRNLLLFFLFGTINTVYALNVNFILEKLQIRCRSLESIKAEFIQKTQVVTAGPIKIKEFEGIMYLKRPSKIRWDYYKPSIYQIISDGENIWFYDAEEKQVMIGKLKTYMDKRLLLSLFLNIKNLKKFFKIDYEEKDKFFILTLIPYQLIPSLKEAQIWIKKDNFEIKQVETKDFYGNKNKFQFVSIFFNPNLEDKFFVFQTPKGTEIIRLPD